MRILKFILPLLKKPRPQKVFNLVTFSTLRSSPLCAFNNQNNVTKKSETAEKKADKKMEEFSKTNPYFSKYADKLKAVYQ